MLICDFCQKQGDLKNMVRCSGCGRIFHKTVKCVAIREIKCKPEKQCPLCGHEAESFLGRFCPACGEHLWSFHMDCGGAFCD